MAILFLLIGLLIVVDGLQVANMAILGLVLISAAAFMAWGIGRLVFRLR